MRYRTYNTNQLMLLPLNISEMIPKDSPLWFVIDLVNADLVRDLETGKSDEGNTAYNPLMLTKLLVYAYFNRIYSSREIAKKTYIDVEFIYLCGSQHPNFRTVCNFRKNNADFLANLYKKVYYAAYKMRVTDIGIISIDGTVIKGNVSGRKGVKKIARWKEIEKELDAQIREYGKRCNEIDKAEDKRLGKDNNGGLPRDLQEMKYRRKKIRQALKKMETEGVDEGVRINPTDPDARFMKKENVGKHKMGYNVGFVVDKNQLIAHVEMTNNSNDRPLFKKCIKAVKETFGGKIPEGTKVLGDNGCFSTDNIKLLEDEDLDGYLNPTSEFEVVRKDRGKREKSKMRFIYDYEKDVVICPNGREMVKHIPKKPYNRQEVKFKSKESCIGCPLKEECCPNRPHKWKSYKDGIEIRWRMVEKMKKEESVKIYKKRRTTVEPVIGDIKHNFGFDSLNIRGFVGMVELGLTTLCHNIKKLFKMDGAMEKKWSYGAI